MLANFETLNVQFGQDIKEIHFSPLSFKVKHTFVVLFRFNVIGPSSTDPSASSEEIPYICAKPCHKASFDDNCDGAAYDDSMYRLLPVAQSYILPKMGHEFSHGEPTKSYT
jgi:hypothetical protein